MKRRRYTREQSAFALGTSRGSAGCRKDLVLAAVMKPLWTSMAPYPGDPYNHNLFKQYFSDHRPIVFKMTSSADDD